MPQPDVALQVVFAGREVNSDVEVLAHASYLRDRDTFQTAGASTVAVDEAETAVALARAVLGRMKQPADRLAAAVERLRTELARPAG